MIVWPKKALQATSAALGGSEPDERRNAVVADASTPAGGYA